MPEEKAGKPEEPKIVGAIHIFAQNSPNCPKCDAPPGEHEIRDHDPIWHDGKVHCKKCGAYVREYDAG